MPAFSLLAAAGTIDTGDTAWMLAATALVLLMTPALGLFYAGLVRSKNTLNTFMMSVAALGAVTVVWALVAYSLAFDTGNGFIGGFHHAFLQHVGLGNSGRGLPIPDLLFMAYRRQAVLPHTSVFVLVGAGLLWFGWFGFNGGSGLSASSATLSFTNTLLAPAATLVVWIVVDYLRGGKATAVGAATAIIVGC